MRFEWNLQVGLDDPTEEEVRELAHEMREAERHLNRTLGLITKQKTAVTHEWLEEPHFIQCDEEE